MGTARTALVTGAGRGIGRAIALRLARAGWLVHAGVRSAAAAESLAAESERIVPVQLDVRSDEEIHAVVSRLPARLDALVNNVGIAVAGPVETRSRADMHRQLDVNLFGPLTLTTAALPHLRRARGRIVFISSVNGRMSFPFTGMYNASKYAVEAVADCLRVELSPFGVGVVLVEPGVIDTDPWHRMGELLNELQAGLTPAHRELYAPHFDGERMLVARLVKAAAPPDTVARVVERELTRTRPRVRVAVGRDARVLLAMKRLLPARALDAVWISGAGLSAPAQGSPLGPVEPGGSRRR